MLSKIFDVLIGFENLNESFSLSGISPEMLVSEMTIEAFIGFSFTLGIILIVFMISILFALYVVIEITAFVSSITIGRMPLYSRFEIWLFEKIIGSSRVDNIVDGYIKKRESKNPENGIC